MFPHTFAVHIPFAWDAFAVEAEAIVKFPIIVHIPLKPSDKFFFGFSTGEAAADFTIEVEFAFPNLLGSLSLKQNGFL